MRSNGKVMRVGIQSNELLLSNTEKQEEESRRSRHIAKDQHQQVQSSNTITGWFDWLMCGQTCGTTCGQYGPLDDRAQPLITAAPMQMQGTLSMQSRTNSDSSLHQFQHINRYSQKHREYQEAMVVKYAKKSPDQKSESSKLKRENEESEHQI